MIDFSRVKALAFDVFGTVVDWRGSIAAEGRASGEYPHVDWEAFADAWREGYGPAMGRVNNGEAPWANIDALHRQILDGILPRFVYDQPGRYILEYALVLLALVFARAPRP